MRKQAGPESSDAAMKRQRKEQTSAQVVSSCGNSVHGMRKKLKPSLPTFPGSLMQASDLESLRMEMQVGEDEMGERPTQSKREEKRMASVCAYQRQRRQCKDCKGSSICEHWRQREHMQGMQGIEHLRASVRKERVHAVRGIEHL